MALHLVFKTVKIAACDNVLLMLAELQLAIGPNSLS